jgi:hypothetical protein
VTLTETWPNPQAPIHDERGEQQLAMLTETRDYTRRIHWWIRLFGVVWLTTMALGVLIGAVAIGIASKSTNTGTNSGLYSSRSACMAAIETTAAECDALFPN